MAIGQQPTPGDRDLCGIEQEFDGTLLRAEDDRGATVSEPTNSRRSTVEQRVAICQPIETIIDFVGEASCLGDRLSAEVDPTYRELRTRLGRQVEVRYTLYQIPGGTQVTAVAQARARSPGPIAALAVRAVRHQIGTELSSLKDDLE
jgi:hypothetical protein